MPVEGEIVIADVKNITDVAVYCSLVAYGDIEAMLPTSEINVKRHRRVTDYIKVGQLIPCAVLRIAGTKIDISVKQCRADEGVVALDKYHRDARINLIVRTAADQEVEAARELYRSVVWPLADAYATFQEVRAQAASDESQLPPLLVAAIQAKMPLTTYNAEKEIMLRFGPFHDGAARLQAALVALAALENIVVYTVAAPKFRVVATDKTEARAAARLEAAIAGLPKAC